MKRVVTLSNGVRLVIVYETCSINAGLAVVIAAGSLYENSPEQQGLTHLVEHLMLHRTERHQTYESLAVAIDQTISDEIVETRPGSLTVAFEIPRSRIRKAIDLAADVVLRPAITREAIDREISRIGDEGDLSADVVEESVDDMAEDLVFDGSPIAQTLLGSPRQLAARTVREVEDWHRTIVRGNRLAIALVGNVNVAEAEQQIRRRFGRVPAGPPFRAPQIVVAQTQPRLRLVERPYKTFQLRVAYPTVGFDHPDRLPLTILHNHLGLRERNSSRLALRLLATGIAYQGETDLWYYTDAGSLTIRIAVRREHLETTLTAVREELDRLRQHRLSWDELDLALWAVKRDARERKYIPLSQSRFLAHQLLATDDAMTSDQFIQAVNRIRARDIRRVAQTTFLPERTNIVLAGPVLSTDDSLVAECLGLTNLDKGVPYAPTTPPAAS